MLLHNLEKKHLIHPPKWLSSNTQYLCVMGSQAYGVSTDTSDVDIYGWCIPPKDLVFPHLAGEISGFGRQIQRFEVWSEHHIKDQSTSIERDFAVYNIVKYFHLCMENNPNMLDSLFVPRNCIIHSTAISENIRENRHLFLHRGSWHKFKGYAYSQMAKIRNKVNSSNEKRAETIATYGYDLKFAYHTVRLMNEVEQILIECDLDLQRNREQLKSIRRGEWTLEQLESYFTNKEHALETAYANSKLPNVPKEDAIKKLLLESLEAHYGSLTSALVVNPDIVNVLDDLQKVIERYKQ